MFEFLLGVIVGALGAGFFAYMWPALFKSTSDGINDKVGRK